MATITSAEITEVGIAAPTFTAADAGGDDWLNSGTEFLLLKNGHASDSTTVSFTAQVTSFESPTYGPATKATRTIVVVAGDTAAIGPFVPSAFNNATGYCQITYSTHTDVSVAIFTLAN